MTIFATPFVTDTRKSTTPSTDSGFKTLDEVVIVMGDNYHVRTPRMLIYRDDDNHSVVFSKDLEFHIDNTVNTG